MQPVALDLSLLKQFTEKWSDFDVMDSVVNVIKHLRKYHTVAIDKNESISYWLEEYKKLKEEITDPLIQQQFDCYFGPRIISYLPVEAPEEDDLTERLAKVTPDKIGIRPQKKNSGDIRYYDPVTFAATEADIYCRLYRLPKTVNVKPGQEFPDLRLFAPYLRNAETVEFCDPFLFKEAKYKSDVQFVLSVLEQALNLKKVIIHCDYSPLNVVQKEAEKKITDKYGRGVFGGFLQYRNPTLEGNHDRFIILDSKRVSIRFTTSFNNLRITPAGKFKANDSFLIEFSEGRKYYDK